MSEENQAPVQPAEKSNNTNKSTETQNSEAGKGFEDVVCAAAELAEKAVGAIKEAGKNVAAEAGSLVLQSQGVPQPVAKILAHGAVNQSENNKPNNQSKNEVTDPSANKKPSTPGNGMSG